MNTTSDARYRDGRDEMNLADFPISALQRAQKSDGAGGKLDRMEFTASRYDAASRGRVAQKVTLTSTARDGLPTPADEHVILALLYVAKHSTNFREARRVVWLFRRLDFLVTRRAVVGATRCFATTYV